MGAIGNIINAGLSTAKSVGSVVSDIVNFGSAQKQMDFQERMSNTAYSRATEDMIRAGLNPALMYGSAGPASTPSGAMAESHNPLGSLPTDIATLFGEQSKARLNTAQEALAYAQAEKVKSETYNLEGVRLLNSALEKKALAESNLPAQQIQEIMARMKEIDTRAILNSAQTAKTKAETPQPQFFGEIFKKGKEGLKNLEHGMDKIINDAAQKLYGPKPKQFRQRGGASGEF